MDTQREDEPWLDEPELLEEEVATPAHKFGISCAGKGAHSMVSCSQAHISICKEALFWGNSDLLQEFQKVTPGCTLEVLACMVKGALETGFAIKIMP